MHTGPQALYYYTLYSNTPADKKGSLSAAFGFVISRLYVHTT